MRRRRQDNKRAAASGVPETRPDVVGRDRLQDVSFDPFGVMPRRIPVPPCVFVTREDLARTKRLAAREKWAKLALKRLLAAAEEPFELPDSLPAPVNPELNHKILRRAELNALALLLTGEEEHRARALAAFRLFARHYPGWPISASDARASSYSLGETRVTVNMAHTYDMLAASGLGSKDDALFRAMLEATREVNDIQPHLTCGNHNTWSLVARLAVGVALRSMQDIHDALYGCDRKGAWRCGLVHQLRHDVLADGLQWERTPGYHFYTLMGLTEAAWLCGNIGVDLWHKEFPTQTVDDGWDLHRAWGPEGTTKCLKAAYDAPFYFIFNDCGFSLVHDSGLANLRGVWIWGIIYELAHEAYGDRKYAWLINRVEREHRERERPGLPMCLHASRGEFDFVRLRRGSWPKGHFSLAEDTTFSLTGRHVSGCSIFPTTGVTVLRQNPVSEGGPGVYMFYGPHSAGHQSPAALHVDLEADRSPLTVAPRSGGYEDDIHLTWLRTTVAHNTVTVDGQPMFPYDCGSNSIWEADRWRDWPSDGVLELFQPDGPYKAVRASNEAVYPGVRLDRTVILAREFAVDVFRVLSEKAHQYDWAMHCVGEVRAPVGVRKVDLGRGLGYRHLIRPRRLTQARGMVNLQWSRGKDRTSAQILAPEGAQVVVAGDPSKPGEKWYGEVAFPSPRSCVLVRVDGDKVVFISLWQWKSGAKGRAKLSVVDAPPDGDIVLRVSRAGRKTELRLPWRPAKVEVNR